MSEPASGAMQNRAGTMKKAGALRSTTAVTFPDDNAPLADGGFKSVPRASVSLLSMPDLVKELRVSRAAIYVWMQPHGGCGFPRPLRLGPKRVMWRVDEVEAWIASRERAGTAKAA